MELTVEISVQSESTQDVEALISQSEWEYWFTVWLNHLEPSLSPIQSYAVGLCLTQDRQMQQFNAKFRHQDKPTDVLAFASLERDALPHQVWETQPLELGDIIISTETAHRQAPEHHYSLKQELAWLASHGLLHLLGWDHPDALQLAHMLNQQNQLLTLVGLL